MVDEGFRIAHLEELLPALKSHSTVTDQETQPQASPLLMIYYLHEWILQWSQGTTWEDTLSPIRVFRYISVRVLVRSLRPWLSSLIHGASHHCLAQGFEVPPILRR